MRPWIMKVYHTKASRYLGVARTPSMLKRFYWWINMNICTQWWLRRCLQYLRKSFRQTIYLHSLSFFLPFSPGVAVSADYFGPPSQFHVEEAPTFFSLRISWAGAPTITPCLLWN